MLFENLTAPGGGPPPHIHTREDEFFYVLDGSFEIRIGDEMHALGPGGFAYVPRGTVHNFRNTAETPSRILVGFTPAAWRASSASQVGPRPTTGRRPRWTRTRSPARWRPRRSTGRGRRLRRLDQQRARHRGPQGRPGARVRACTRSLAACGLPPAARRTRRSGLLRSGGDSPGALPTRARGTSSRAGTDPGARRGGLAPARWWWVLPSPPVADRPGRTGFYGREGSVGQAVSRGHGGDAAPRRAGVRRVERVVVGVKAQIRLGRDADHEAPSGSGIAKRPSGSGIGRRLYRCRPPARVSPSQVPRAARASAAV